MDLEFLTNKVSNAEQAMSAFDACPDRRTAFDAGYAVKRVHELRESIKGTSIVLSARLQRALTGFLQ